MQILDPERQFFSWCPMSIRQEIVQSVGAKFVQDLMICAIFGLDFDRGDWVDAAEAK